MHMHMHTHTPTVMYMILREWNWREIKRIETRTKGTNTGMRGSNILNVEHKHGGDYKMVITRLLTMVRARKVGGWMGYDDA